MTIHLTDRQLWLALIALGSITLSFGFCLGWAARWALTDLEPDDGWHIGHWEPQGDEWQWVCDTDCRQSHGDDLADVIPFPEQPGA